MSSNPRTPQGARHPCPVAFDRYREQRPDRFDPATIGRDAKYLENRLNEAFNEGWLACERAVKAAIDGRPL